jgi:hypothetical protein
VRINTDLFVFRKEGNGIMKALIILLLILTVFPIFNFPRQNDLPDSSATIIIPPENYFPVIVYPMFSMRSGSESMLTLHKGLSVAENKLIGLITGSESNLLGMSSGFLGRYAKYILIDIPTEVFVGAIVHEYYGHGSRLREFRYINNHYHFSIPFPFGTDGNWASGGTSDYIIGRQERISLITGGIEALSILNKNISLNWMMKNEIDYRKANIYFINLIESYFYIQNTNDILTNNVNGKDPENYIKLINTNAGYTDLSKLKMTVRDMKSKTKILLVNPFLIYSIFTVFKTFLWDGDETNKLPTIHFGELNYLPSLRAGLTPFGIEYHLENFFRLHEKISLVDFGYGDQTFYDSWGSVGILVHNIYKKDVFAFDVHCNVWKQPGITFGLDNSEIRGSGIGGAFSVRGYYDISNPWLSISAVLELGYKSVGFLEGYDLDSSPIIMVGFALRN